MLMLKNCFVKIRVSSKSITNSDIFWLNKVNENLIILKKIRNTYTLTLPNLLKNYYCTFKENIKLLLWKFKII